MKVFVLCNSDILAINAIHQLQQNNQLAGVGISYTYANHLSRILQSVGISQKDIHVFNKQNLESSLSTLISLLRIDCIVALSFPWKIPATILSKPLFGCINFHFGILPLYRGADPIFWQIRNQEAKGGITVHFMNEEIDAGDILHVAEIPIASGETYGMFSIRLAMLAAELIGQLPAIVQMPPRKQQLNLEPAFFKSPDLQALSIQWHMQSAVSIVALVNAANPKYHGAVTTIKQQTVRFLSLTIVEVNAELEFSPGTIVHADATYGLIVACLDKEFVNINMVHLKEGYLTGIKMFNLGLQIGDQFQ
jgi:methionyl-tRNA formyltransferase